MFTTTTLSRCTPKPTDAALGKLRVKGRVAAINAAVRASWREPVPDGISGRGCRVPCRALDHSARFELSTKSVGASALKALDTHARAVMAAIARTLGRDSPSGGRPR